MEIFSEVKNSVENVVKKSGELVGVTKLKMAIADTKNNLHEQFATLGEITYEVEKSGGLSADTEELIARIDNLSELLKAQEKELAALTKKKICSVCGAAGDIDAVFCSKCGTRFSDEDEVFEEE